MSASESSIVDEIRLFNRLTDAMIMAAYAGASSAFVFMNASDYAQNHDRFSFLQSLQIGASTASSTFPVTALAGIAASNLIAATGTSICRAIDGRKKRKTAESNSSLPMNGKMTSACTEGVIISLSSMAVGCAVVTTALSWIEPSVYHNAISEITRLAPVKTDCQTVRPALPARIKSGAKIMNIEVPKIS